MEKEQSMKEYREECINIQTKKIKEINSNLESIKKKLNESANILEKIEILLMTTRKRIRKSILLSIIISILTITGVTGFIPAPEIVSTVIYGIQSMLLTFSAVSIVHCIKTSKQKKKLINHHNHLYIQSKEEKENLSTELNIQKNALEEYKKCNYENEKSFDEVYEIQNQQKFNDELKNFIEGMINIFITKDTSSVVKYRK